MILGFLLPFLLIPLIKPKYLLLCMIPFAQIVLTATGGGALIWQTHYATLFLPGLFMAFIFAFKKLNKTIDHQFNSKYLLISLLIISNIYLIFSLGPLVGIKKLYGQDNQQIKKTLKSIPPDTSIVAGYNFLPHLSSRQHIYAFHYFLLDQQQFATDKYDIKQKPEYIIISPEDIMRYDTHLAHLTWSKPYYVQGHQRLKDLLANHDIVLSQTKLQGGIEIDDLRNTKLVVDNGDYQTQIKEPILLLKN